MAVDYQPYRFSRLAKAAKLHAASPADQYEASGLPLADMQQIMTAVNRYAAMFNTWNGCGRQVFDMTEPMQALAGKTVPSPEQIPGDGYPDAFYVHFGRSAGLMTPAGDFIDGVLLILAKKSVSSKLECAFVCGSEAPGDTNSTSLVEILRTQGRLAFATAPVQDLSAFTMAKDVGDPTLLSDSVMVEAVKRLQLALAFLAEPALESRVSDNDAGTAFTPF